MILCVQGLLPLVNASFPCCGIPDSSHLLLQYSKGKQLHPCAIFFMGLGSAGFGFTSTGHVSGVCRGYRLWRLHPLSGWGIPDWIRSSITAIYSCAVFLMEWGLSVSGMCRGYCLWRLHPLPGWGIPDWIMLSFTAICHDQRCRPIRKTGQ